MSLRLIWQTLNDVTRLRLLHLLGEEEVTVSELQEILHLGQSRISTHLSVLRSAGLVSTRREGKHTYYTLAHGLDAKTRQLIDAAWMTLKEIPEAEKDAAGLKLVLQKRRLETQTYFNRIAGKLGKAFCPGRTWSAVGPLLAQLVPHCTIVDLGAGEGWLSQLLSQNAAKVIAIDNSPKMVEFGRTEAKRRKITNLEYRLGDLAEPPVKPGTVDIVIMSQALHHAVNPSQAIQASARLLKPGGKIVILDLNQHSFDKARELYGDYWLGFAESDLRAWLKQAGFSEINFQLLEPDETGQHLQPCLATGTLRGKSS